MIYNDTLTNKNVDETLAVNFVSGFLFVLNGSFFLFSSLLLFATYCSSLTSVVFGIYCRVLPLL